MNYQNHPVEQIKKWLNEAIENEDYEKARLISIEIEVRKVGKPREKTFRTEFQAISLDTKELTSFEGEHILAENWDAAEDWCLKNKPWLEVCGQLVSIIPTKGDNYEADFDNRVDYN